MMRPTSGKFGLNLPDVVNLQLVNWAVIKGPSLGFCWLC